MFRRSERGSRQLLKWHFFRAVADLSWCTTEFESTKGTHKGRGTYIKKIKTDLYSNSSVQSPYFPIFDSVLHSQKYRVCLKISSLLDSCFRCDIRNCKESHINNCTEQETVWQGILSLRPDILHYCWLLTDFIFVPIFPHKNAQKKKVLDKHRYAKERYSDTQRWKSFFYCRQPRSQYLWVRASSSILTPISNTYQWLIFLCSLLFLNTFTVVLPPLFASEFCIEFACRFRCCFRPLSSFSVIRFFFWSSSHFGIIHSNKACAQSNSQHNKT